MDNLIANLDLYVGSGVNDLYNRGERLQSLFKKFNTVCNTLKAGGANFSSEFLADFTELKTQIQNSTTAQKQYIEWISHLQNHGVFGQRLVDTIRGRFQEITVHLDELSTDFREFLTINQFAIKNDKILVVDSDEGSEVYASSVESIDEGPVAGPSQEKVLDVVTDVEVMEPRVEMPAVASAQPEVEPITLVPARGTSELISSIEVSLPLNCFSFRGVPIRPFCYFKPNYSLAVNPGLELKYASNGWSAMFVTDINFTIANRVQRKNKPLARVSIQKNTNLAQVSVNTDSQMNLNYSRHIGTVQNTDVRCGINLNVENTVVQISDFSFKAKFSPHGDALNPSFVCSPSLCLQVYPFWNHYASSSRANGDGQLKMLNGSLANFQSSGFVFGFSNKPVLQNSVAITKTPNFDKIYVRDSEISNGVLPLSYTSNQNISRLHTPTTSLIFVGILAVGVFTLSFLKKLFKSQH